MLSVKIRKACVLLYSKEATNKDNQLKAKMLVSFQADESKGSEKIWLESGFFGDQRADLDSYVLKGYYILNVVIIYCPVYNKSAGMYGGLNRKLGYITLRGDDRERFYSCSFNKEKCSLFYCHMKTPLPNIFSCTAFKNHLPYLLDENQNKAKFSNMFFYLPSTLDRKEDFLKWKEHVHLHPIDLSFDDLTEITGNKEMNPYLLNNKDLRGEVVAYYMLMKKIAETSNQNLVRNSDAYISNGGKIDPDNEFSWIDDSYQLSKEKFQLSY